MSENKCPKCGSLDTAFVKEGYIDDHHEMIEAFLVCNDCEYDERKS